MADASGFVELARVWRGPVVESVHRGAVAVVDLSGKLRFAWGDHGLVTPPRSALKPFQAVALVESGAADAFGLTDEHIALACASHHAQPFQVALIGDWLGRLGYDEGALICGPALPRGTADMASAFAHGGPRRIFNNCSGKHCAMLSITRHLGADINYAHRDHPAQRMYLDVLSEFTGRPAASLPYGVDGCGLPAIALSLGDMAKAAAAFSAGQARSAARRAAVRRVLNAMAMYPDHISGIDEPAARLIRATGGQVIAKGGAEGYLLGFVRSHGVGVAIKIADGGSRAKYGVLARVLPRLGAYPAAQTDALVEALEPPITDTNGNVIGRVEVPFQRELRGTTPTEANAAFWFSGVPVLEDLVKAR